MNRSFTTREKILLLLLTIMILGVGYFKLFYQSMQEQITASQQRQILPPRTSFRLRQCACSA